MQTCGEKMKKTINTKGRHNFKVEKIKAHQTQESQKKNTGKENQKRKENEQADFLAVKGAQQHSIEQEYLKERRDFIIKCKEVQIYLIEVMKMRGNKIQEVYGNNTGRNKHIGYQNRKRVLQELAKNTELEKEIWENRPHKEPKGREMERKRRRRDKTTIIKKKKGRKNRKVKWKKLVKQQ